MFRKNFPSRRRKRQEQVVTRLEAQLANPSYIPKRFKGSEPTKTDLAQYRQLIAQQVETLKKRIQESV